MSRLALLEDIRDFMLEWIDLLIKLGILVCPLNLNISWALSIPEELFVLDEVPFYIIVRQVVILNVGFMVEQIKHTWLL